MQSDIISSFSFFIPIYYNTVLAYSQYFLLYIAVIFKSTHYRWYMQIKMNFGKIIVDFLLDSSPWLTYIRDRLRQFCQEWRTS